MNKKIKLYYHDGYYDTTAPLTIVKNLFKHGKIHTPVYNIGDQISPIVVSSFSGKRVRHAQPFEKRKLLAIGSILAGIKSGDKAWGTGLMKPEHVKYVASEKNIDIVAVRGPKTYQALIKSGVPCGKVFGDPGILMPKLFCPYVEKKYLVGVIPHITQIKDFDSLDGKSEYSVISPRLNWRQFITKILECELIASSSLHGVILAESYGLPTVPLKHGEFLHGTPFKFEDYFLSTDREPIFADSKDVWNREKLTKVSAEIGKPCIDTTKLLEVFPYLDKSQDPAAIAKKLA